MLNTICPASSVKCQSRPSRNTRRGSKRQNSDHDVDRVGTRKVKRGNDIVRSEQDALLWAGDIFGLETEEKDIHPPSNVCSAGAYGQDDLMSEVVSNVFSNLEQGIEDEESSWLLGESSQFFMLESESDNDLQHELPMAQILETDGQQLRDAICKSPTTHAHAPPVRPHAPPVDPLSPPDGIMSDLELTKFTIEAVRKYEQPALLTLTSFPFRVLYSNSTYQRMTGDGSSIVGRTFYDIFVKEGKEGPSFGACPSLVGQFQEDVVRVHSSSNERGVYSTLHVLPVLRESKSRESDLRYYIVTLKHVEVPKGASIVYLPMPSRSMPTF
jgi:hypothetical protein